MNADWISYNWAWNWGRACQAGKGIGRGKGGEKGLYERGRDENLT